MSDASAICKTVRPTLHHFGLTTANLEAMLDWYCKVLGMTPNHQTSKPNTVEVRAGAQQSPTME